jgi:hypothetical protein
MASVIEHHGRLARSDGRDLAAGRFDLRFRLHLHPEGPASVWEEQHPRVAVLAGGHYSVLLGKNEPFDEATFEEPRWLGVYVDRDGASVEVGPRAVMAGASVRLYWAVQGLTERVAAAETATAGRFTSRENVDPEARARLVKLHRRLKRVEGAGRGVGRVANVVADLEARMARLDDEERGRVLLLEDELRDIVGADGDIIDLIERVEALERGHGGPMRLAGVAALESRLAAAEATSQQLQRNVEALGRALELVARQIGEAAAAPLPEVLPGPLTIQRGGVHVAGGGLVIHDIEGRQAGASRREGPLLVNAKSGADLIVGSRAEGSVVATASLRAGRAAGVQRAVAVRLGGEGLTAGDVVVADTHRKALVARRAGAGAAPLGVVVERAAVELGEGAVLVAVTGLVRVRVDGPVEAGVLLVAGADGVATTGDGPRFGRTVAASSGGLADVLLSGAG